MSRVPFDPATDYYKLLGVPPDASIEEIQAAYRRLAKAYHPDLHAGSSVAAARMARVNVAKSVLLDGPTRAQYDQLRAGRRFGSPHAVATTVASRAPSVSYAPHTPPGVTRPRYRVVRTPGRNGARGSLDRQTGILVLIAVPLIAALLMYVFQAIQLSMEPLHAPPSDLALAPNGKPTPRGTAEAVFIMVHAQPLSAELATRANNLILSRADGTPESELLRANGRRLVRAATARDQTGWDAAVSEICVAAGHC